MPTYAYRGSECGHEFEVRQSFSEDPISECVDCGKPVHRVIHPAGIVFKGTGWYITDSRPTTETNGGVQDAAKVVEKKGENGSADSTPSKTDTKSEPAAVGAGTASSASTATSPTSGKDA